MKNILMLFILLTAAATGKAQSPVGKWKLKEGWETTHTNKNVDFLRDMYRKQPCLEKLVYIFSANGGISLEKNHCEAVDADGTPAFGTRWTLKKTILTVGNDEMDEQVFEIELKGNKMMWRATFRDPGSKQEKRAINYVFEKV